MVMTENRPNVIIPSEEKARLAARWSNAFIVKLMGRMINPDYLEAKLWQLWAKHGEVEVSDVGAGFAVVNFAHKNDYELALTGGPWLI